MAHAANLHATAVLLGDFGVVITGASGSGKTTLALALIDRFSRAGQFSRLVSDDQILVEATADGRLLCRTPQPIAGLAEVYGFGPARVDFESWMIADLLVRLVPAVEAQRFPEVRAESVAGTGLPCLTLAARNTPAAVLAISARLSAAPFR